MGLRLTTTLLDSMWPRASHSLVDGVADTSELVFSKYGLTTPAEVSDLMAQGSEETGGATAIEENLNYSITRLQQVWPSHFPTYADAMPFAHNPRALADLVYGGRYGNRPHTDDGWNFRGRGLIQLTFQANYEVVAKASGIDLLAHPELINSPAYFLEVACAYWHQAGANAYADRNQFIAETRRINGGLTNLQTRLAWRARWRRALGVE